MLASFPTRLLDLGLAVWIACWIGLGAAIGVQVEDLSTLTSTVVREGHAVEHVAGSISGLSGLPFVGKAVAEDSHEARQAGAAAVRGAHSSEGTIHTLGILLAIAVSLLPTVAILGLYIPLRAKLKEGVRRRALSPTSGGRSGGDGGDGGGPSGGRSGGDGGD